MLLKGELLCLELRKKIFLGLQLCTMKDYQVSIRTFHRIFQTKFRYNGNTSLFQTSKF